MATAKDKKTKVLVNVYNPLLRIVKDRFDKACLKRDAYLDKALQIEAELLRSEITESNSDKAKSYIVKNFKKLDLKPLNLLLSEKTVLLINDVCKEKNISRDSFINRFLLLLTASDSVLNVLFDDEKEVLLEGGDFYGPEEVFYIRSNVIDTIEEFTSTSPLFWLRAGFEEYSSKTLNCYVIKRKSLCSLPAEYDLLKTNNALGFNVFMSDDDIRVDELLQIPDLDPGILDLAIFEEVYEIEKRQKAERVFKNTRKGEKK